MSKKKLSSKFYETKLKISNMTFRNQHSKYFMQTSSLLFFLFELPRKSGIDFIENVYSINGFVFFVSVGTST